MKNKRFVYFNNDMISLLNHLLEENKGSNKRVENFGKFTHKLYYNYL